MNDSDEDLCKFAEQGREVEVVVAGWKKSELLRESVEADIVRLRTELQYVAKLSSAVCFAHQLNK